ncbi:MAG: L-threonylcarbamoyladenylate synthase [Acidobacteriota bacterium]
MKDRAIETVAGSIRDGAVVAFPTETFYGLGADPRQPAALQRVLDLKGRDAQGKPLLLLAASLEQIAPWVRELPNGFDLLVAHFWPGPLTLVLPAAAGIPAPLLGPGGGIALRVTSHPLARALIAACGTAITGTSANPSGAPPPRTAEQVRAAFGASSPQVLDGGVTPGGPPSTLIELGADGIRVLRAGAVAEEELRRVLRLL